MYKKISFLILALPLSLVACRSTQFQERVTRLEAKINELDGSKQYFADMTASELFDLREEAVLLLLEEGEYQLKLIGTEGNDDAKDKALLCFESVQKLANRPLSVQNEELRQRWNAISWAWDDLLGDGSACSGRYHPGKCRNEWKIWQGCKLLIPGLQAYSAPETVIAFIGDLIFSWGTTVEGKIDVPALSSLHVATAEAGLRRLNQEGIRKESEVNAEIAFSYLLTAPEEELATLSGLVERYSRLPGLDGQYQELLDGMIVDWLEEQRGYITKKSFNVIPRKGGILVRVIVTGYVPTEKLPSFLKKYMTEIRLPDPSEPARFSSVYIDRIRDDGK